MKSIKLTKLKVTCVLGCLLLGLVGCDRDISDDAVPATFPNIADIFTDAPVNLTDEFFESFDPAAGANPNGFGTDDNEAYVGTSSIRIDVPAPNDPDGGFIGGIFRDRGDGRDLTNYDALTFWAKGSTTATIGTVGFGNDFGENEYAVTVNDLQLSTDWKKYTIPIPDASKLTQERGMFIFSAGAFDINNTPADFSDDIGYTFWIDELRFENLGTHSLVYPFILDGADIEIDGFIGENQRISQVGALYNLASGLNQTVNAAPGYFNFESSNNAVTGAFDVNMEGEAFVPIIGLEGVAVVTATLGDTLAEGSLTINAVGAFPHAPIPTRSAANVVSLFSDAYTNVPVRHYNGFFAPFQTTEGGAGSDPNNVDIQAPFADGSIDNIINYTVLNFVSIGMYETVPLVDVSGMTHLHLDINVRETLSGSDFIRLSLESGTGGTVSSGEFVLSAATLGAVDSNGWASIDIPLSSFSGFSDPANLGQLFFISDATVTDIWVDNVYFYNE